MQRSCATVSAWPRALSHSDGYDGTARPTEPGIREGNVVAALLLSNFGSNVHGVLYNDRTYKNHN